MVSQKVSTLGKGCNSKLPLNTIGLDPSNLRIILLVTTIMQGLFLWILDLVSFIVSSIPRLSNILP